MAKRINLRQDEQTRARIQTTKICERVQQHAMGKLELTATQLKAAEILLRKTLPDLQAVTHSGDQHSPIKHVFSWALPGKPQG